MPANFQRLKAGQPWRVSQATADAMIAAAEQYAKHDRDRTGPPPTYEFQGDMIDVRNDSGADQARFNVPGLEAALITDAQNLREFQNYPRFSGVVPTWPAHVGEFCVLVEPLAVGAIGKALVSGIVPVQLQPLPAAAQQFMFADILSGYNGRPGRTQLGSSPGPLVRHGRDRHAVGLGTALGSGDLIRVQLTAKPVRRQSASANVLGLNPDLSRFAGAGPATAVTRHHGDRLAGHRQR